MPTTQGPAAENAPRVVGSSGVAPPAPSEEAQLDLELLRLCFDESEFGNMDGALRSRSAAQKQAAADGDAAAAASDAASDAPRDDDGEPAFNAHTFVAAKLEHVSADALERDLQTYERHLEAAVLKCVHDEVHEAFVHVSGELVSMETTIAKVQQPLADMEAKVARMRESVEVARNDAQGVLKEAAKHEIARAFFASLLEASLVHNDTRRTIDAQKAKIAAEPNSPSRAGGSRLGTSPTSPSPSAPGPSPSASDAAEEAAQNEGTTSSSDAAAQYPSDLAFLCASVVRLGQLCANIQACAPPDSDSDDAKSAKELFTLVEQDASDVRDLVSAHFFECHRRYLASPSASSGAALGHATSLFAQLGDDDGFAATYRERVVRPVVEEVITWRDVKAASASAEHTERVFARLIVDLESGIFVALPLVQRALGRDAPSLIATAVWPAIGDTVGKRMMHFFAPGLPNKFHKSFAIAARLVAALEAKCATAGELRALRTCRDMSLWRSKWNLDTYHEMRKHEMDERLKAAGALVGPFKTVSSAADADAIKPFSVPEFHSVLQELCVIFDPDRVFIYALQHRFLRDACDLVVALIDAAVARCVGMAPLDVIEVMRNCAALSKAASITLADRVQAALAGDAAAASQTIKLLRGVIESGVVRTRRSLVEGLVKACMRELGLVTGLKRIFSTSNMPMPTQRSEYLKGALAEVARFRDDATKGGALSKDECKEVTLEVMHEATKGLHAAVKNVLANAKRQQDSLDKLNRSKAQGPPAEKPREKIVMQLYLDVHEYGDMLRGFGVNKETDPGFKALLALVNDRAQWVLNDCQGPEPADTH